MLGATEQVVELRFELSEVFDHVTDPLFTALCCWVIMTPSSFKPLMKAHQPDSSPSVFLPVKWVEAIPDS